jgi:surface antigen
LGTDFFPATGRFVKIIAILAVLPACQATLRDESLVSSVGTRTSAGDLFSQIAVEDWNRLKKARQTALEKSVSGKSVSWTGSRTGMRGSVTPLKTWKTDKGIYCRTYREKVRTANGQAQSRTGKACRDSAAKVWKTA